MTEISHEGPKWGNFVEIPKFWKSLIVEELVAEPVHPLVEVIKPSGLPIDPKALAEPGYWCQS